MTLLVHGGDLDAARSRWGSPSQGWLDLSTGINPWPYPIPEIPAAAWHRLPGKAEERALLEAARRRWGLPMTAGLVAAPGSQPLIQALPRLLPPGPVAVVAPTYGEHAAAWRAAGHQVFEVAGIDDVGNAQAVVVVNPNNPDGRTTEPQALLALSCRLGETGGLLVVDEAFGETVPDLSLLPSCRGAGLAVLRSFGKFHGLAGLRLGFAAGSPELTERLAAMLGPWAVSGPALAVGARALEDVDWGKSASIRLERAAEALRAVLARAGLEIVGGTSLFVLASHPEAGRLYDRLGRAGILVRAFAHRPQWLRFGLPGAEAELARLGAALSQE